MQKFAGMPRLYMVWTLHLRLREQNTPITIEKIEFERDRVCAVVESRSAAIQPPSDRFFREPTFLRIHRNFVIWSQPVGWIEVRFVVANRRITIPNRTSTNQFSYTALFCHASPHDPRKPARMTAPSPSPTPQGRAQCAAFANLEFRLIPFAPRPAHALHQLAFHASLKTRKKPCISPLARLSAAGPDSPWPEGCCRRRSAPAARRPLLARHGNGATAEKRPAEPTAWPENTVDEETQTYGIFCQPHPRRFRGSP